MGAEKVVIDCANRVVAVFAASNLLQATVDDSTPKSGWTRALAT